MKKILSSIIYISCLLAGADVFAFTSLYSSVTVAGTFNGYNTTNNPMALVSNNVWRSSIALGGVTNPAFLFVTNGGFGTTWKVTNQPVQPFPVSGVAITGGSGSDITLTGVFSGKLVFQLDSATRAYWVDYEEGPWTSRYDYVNLAGTFNGYETFSTNMIMLSNGVWQSYVVFPTTVTNPAFLFATKNFTNSWKESDQSVFTLPLSGTAEFNTGNDISIAGAVKGTLRFQFNERTGAYRVEDVTPLNQAEEPWINEFHYDNASTDSNEFIEVAGPAGITLTNYQIVLYNSSSLALGAMYSTTNLSGTITNQMNGFGALAFFYPRDGLQNGPNDGMALVKNGTQVVHFVSYEGVVVAGDGPAAGMTSTDVGVSENGNGPWNYSIQMRGTGAVGTAFTWAGPTNNSPGSINASQVTTAGPPPSLLLFSNLVHKPASPGTNDLVYVEVDASPYSGASNIFLTTFYRVGTNSLFYPLAMSQTGTHYRTFRPIPVQSSGNLIQYYVFASFAGKGTNSPAYYPVGAPGVVRSYGVSITPGGSVWINEFDPYGGLWADGDNWEFIELAGVAGSDISGWLVRLYDESVQLYSTYVLPAGSILPNDTNGFGFFLMGNPIGLPWADFAMTNMHVSGMLDEGGGIELVNEFGSVQQSVWYGALSAPQGFNDSYFVDDEFSPASATMVGTGGRLNDFSWSGTASPSPGAINDSQVLVGGNTNPLAPVIYCPSSIYYSCLSSPVPTVNVASVTATGLCAGGSVTVTHAGDVTNSGTGCAGSPKIITRTYRAVSACGTTSTCSQLIVYEDSSGPSVTLIGGTQELVNAGFESGTVAGWTTFGEFSNQVSGAVVFPYQGFGHGQIQDPAPAFAADATGNGNDGRIIGAPRRGVAATNATAYSFDGSRDRIEIPYSDMINNSTTFSFSVWVRPDPGTGTLRAVVGQVTNLGYNLYQSTNNTWRFTTGLGTNVNELAGPLASTTAWSHIVCTYSNSLKLLYVNGAPVATTTVNYAANTQAVTRIGAGSSGTSTGLFFFKGAIDDVQLYNTALGLADVTNLYRGGLGQRTGVNVQAHLKLDEAAYATNTVAGLYQALPASSGQTWSVSAYLQSAGGTPIREGNRAAIELQYLSNTTVVQSVTSQPVTVTTASNVYFRFTASAQATQAVTSARALLRYQRFSDAAGILYFDQFGLTRFAFDPGSNCTYALPDLRVNVTASDACSVVSTSQSPSVGASLPVGEHNVTISAVDQCGQTGSVTIRVAVVDSAAPVLSVSNITVTCDTMINATSGITVVDCSPVTVLTLSEIVSGGNGCSGSTARLTTRVLQAVDDAGYTTYATQLISQVRTAAPSISVSQTGSLLNAGFELGSLTNWSLFGSVQIATNTPRTGVRSARLAGQNSIGTNYNGFYQNQPARGGQHWRAAGWILSPFAEPLSGGNYALVKLEYLNANQQLLSALETPLFTTNSGIGAHTLLSVQGVAPEGTAWARLTVLLVQADLAGGAVYVDDLSLSQTVLTSVGGVAALPSMVNLAVSSNTCSEPLISQVPIAGSAVSSGWTNISLVALDDCGRSSTTRVALLVMDDAVESLVPPAPSNVVIAAVSMGGTNVVVRSLGNSAWSVVPEYATNLLAPVWLPISNSVNAFNGGTNITSFDYPVTNTSQGVIIRVWQRYP